MFGLTAHEVSACSFFWLKHLALAKMVRYGDKGCAAQHGLSSSTTARTALAVAVHGFGD